MILDRYLARRFARSLGLTILGFFLILSLIDLVEQIRRHSRDADGLGPILQLTLLNVPRGLYEILPLVTILAGVALFLGLGRSSELVVVRGAGRSGLRALLGPLAVTLIFGVLAVAVLNPVVAATTSEYEARERRIDGRDPVLALADGGLWLRQGGDAGPTVIRATTASADGTRLGGVTFLTLDPEGRPVARIEAREARLGDGLWLLADAKEWALDAPNPEASAMDHAALELPAALTAGEIRDSLGEPSQISIWEMPRFIERLEAAGFTARRHLVYLHMELALPAFLAAMLLLAATFTMQPQRGRRMGTLVLAAVLTGFAAQVVRNFARVLGEAGQVPPALAAWAPPAAAILLALGLLLHLEEG
jgi:lipopolysaccharide export system permease protein